MIKKTELNNLYGKDYHCSPSCVLQMRARLYLKQILKHVPIKRNYDILEIGCNHGQLSQLLKSYSKTVIGVDINHTVIQNSNKNYLQVMDACNLNFPDCSFDLIVSTHTIEHIPETLKVFKEMERVLKIGSHIVLIYPWEPIRGCTVLPETLWYHRSLKMCRQIHHYAFTPKKINSLIKHTCLIQKVSKMFYVPQPNYISFVQKYG